MLFLEAFYTEKCALLKMCSSENVLFLSTDMRKLHAIVEVTQTSLWSPTHLSFISTTSKVCLASYVVHNAGFILTNLTFLILFLFSLGHLQGPLVSATNNIMWTHTFTVCQDSGTTYLRLICQDNLRKLNLNWRFIYGIIFKTNFDSNYPTLSLSLYTLCQDSCIIQLYLIVILYISS